MTELMGWTQKGEWQRAVWTGGVAAHPSIQGDHHPITPSERPVTGDVTLLPLTCFTAELLVSQSSCYCCTHTGV